MQSESLSNFIRHPKQPPSRDLSVSRRHCGGSLSKPTLTPLADLKRWKRRKHVSTMRSNDYARPTLPLRSSTLSRQLSVLWTYCSRFRGCRQTLHACVPGFRSSIMNYACQFSFPKTHNRPSSTRSFAESTSLRLQMRDALSKRSRRYYVIPNSQQHSMTIFCRFLTGNSLENWTLPTVKHCARS